MIENSFRIGARYRDRGSAKRDGDQFLSWLKGPLETGIKNTGGIRPLSGTRSGEPACIVLVSNDEGVSQHEDPWQDHIDISAGHVAYWGDAKATNPYDQSAFNRTLKRAFDRAARKEREHVPPVLMFRKPEPGIVEFCGLCIPDHIELREHRAEDGSPIPNYRFHFNILDVESIPVSWIHDRARFGDDSSAPSEWQEWVRTGMATRWPDGFPVSEQFHEEFPSWWYEFEGEEVRVSSEFRASILKRYRHRCVATGIDHQSLLDLAHVLPRSNYPEYAGRPENVLVLNPLHHRAFDADLFTLDGDFRVYIDPQFDPIHPLLRETLVKTEGESIEIPDGAPLATEFLKRRNEQLAWW